MAFYETSGGWFCDKCGQRINNTLDYHDCPHKEINIVREWFGNRTEDEIEEMFRIHILLKWDRAKTIKFAKHLLGDKYWSCKKQ